MAEATPQDPAEPAQGDFDDLIAAAERFLATASGTSPYTVKMTHWERKLYQQTRAVHQGLGGVHWKMNEDVDYAEQLLTDIFAYLWLATPRILPREDVLPTRWDNHKVLTIMDASPEVATLRSATVHDETATAGAIVWLADSIRAWLKAQEEEVEIETKISDALQRLTDDLAAGKDPGEAAEGLAQALDEAGVGPNFDETPEEIDGLDDAAARAADRFSEVSMLGSMIGLSSRGSNLGNGKKLSSAQAWAALERLSSTGLKKYADMIGRFMSTATRGVRPAPIPTGVELSDRVQDADASELAARRHRLLRLEHLERVASGELITSKYTGKAEKAGPLVLVVDESTSMRWGQDPFRLTDVSVTPQTWSKAFALAMHAQAKAANRRFVIISFASSCDQKVWVDPDAVELVDYLQHFFSGETAYEEALDTALDVVESYPGMRAADIVLVTDDDRPDVPADWHTRWSQRRAEVKPVPPRLRGVGVSAQTGAWLSTVADDVVMITDFTSEEQVSRAARTF